MARGEETRNRILDIAQESILAKGFDATTIEEIVVNANITKSGFFYHFRDKNALAAALIERHIEVEERMFGDLLGRARELSDDPLQVALIGLKLFAETIEDLPNGLPGCIIAATVYQNRLFHQRVHQANRRAVLDFRDRFRKVFDDIAAVYPARENVDLDDLSDMLAAVIEGGIILSRATNDPKVTARQVMMLRSYIKLLFAPRPA